jgi:UDP-glucose 4-epimerase
MQRTVLITGGFGFLGRAIARKFKQQGCRVVGIGRGRWGAEEALAHGFDSWLDASISLSSLMTLGEQFDVVAHCGGNGSVGYSLEHPLQDFEKTVQGTIELLEYLRVTKSQAVLVYPSSAGVYGAKDDAPIRETDALNPISPYGYHKRIAEELLESYSRAYGIKVAIIRFFSIYGPGLTKQLLWDASAKLRAGVGGSAEFWGTGEETRDWISGEDAAELMVAASRAPHRFVIVNGAGGQRVTVAQILEMLKSELGVDTRIRFTGMVREGDPRFYHADVQRALALDWEPTKPLKEGIRHYVQWLKSYQEHQID